MYKESEATRTRLVTEGIKIFPLTVNEAALAHALLHDNGDGVTRYVVDSGGDRRIETISHERWPALVDKFRKDPKSVLAIARQNLFAISSDQKLPIAERKPRVERYLELV